MLKEIKKELLSTPQHIVDILDTYEFYKVHIKGNEIRCGLAEGHNPTAIRIKIVNNDNLYVSDYTRGLSKDLISYIITVKNTDFASVMSVIKAQLGIDDFYNFNTRRSVFGGFYDRIKNRSSNLYVRTYNKSVLTQFKSVYTTRMTKDNIGFSAQDYFNLGYDVESQRITIPIYNAFGEIIGVKGRTDFDSDVEPKYLYLIPCAMSTTLYGYSHNYEHLQDNDILVFEAEKSCMQCYTYGIRNCVAVGSNSLSPAQCKLLMGLNPKRIIFMFDKDLPYENTIRNVKMLKNYTRMSDVSVCWWDWSKNTTIGEKQSPSDCGADTLKKILENEIAEVIL